MSTRLGLVLLAFANLLIAAAILTFAIGFFPYKPFLPGTAQYHNGEDEQILESPFDKIVFMVVDALRRYQTTYGVQSHHELNLCSDFVYSNKSGFQYTQRCTF